MALVFADIASRLIDLVTRPTHTEAQAEKVEGFTYKRSHGDLEEFEFPSSEPVEIHALDSVLPFARGLKDARDGVFIHIVGPYRVDIIGQINRELNRSRENYGCAKPLLQDPVAHFVNKFHEPEDFNIALQRLFLDKGVRADLLKLAGNVVAEAVNTYVDDGRTQEVTTRGGAARLGTTALINPVSLVPLRTFPEIEIDLVPFVFRAQSRTQGDKPARPSLALFESDNGAWMVDAMNKIRARLTSQLKPEDTGIVIL